MKYLFASLLLALVVLAVGCRSHDVTYVDPAGNEMITDVGQINIQDWNNAAAEMVNDLLQTQVLTKAEDRRSVVMVSAVRNNTSAHVDTDLLTKNIRIALNKSGQAYATTAVHVGGPEEEASMGVRELRDNDEFDPDTIPGRRQLQAPDYALGGKIIQLSSQAGRTSQSTFVFQMSLTDLRTGLAVWEDQVEIIKQGKRSGLSW